MRANFPSDSDLGHIDPTLFLSVYLVTYPILQWSLGGWILAPGDDEKDDKTVVASVAESFKRMIQNPMSANHQPLARKYRNVLNNKSTVDARRSRTKGLTSNDEGCYMTELDLTKLEQEWENEHADKLKAIPYNHDDSISSDEEDETCPLVESSTHMYDATEMNQSAIVSGLPPLLDSNNRIYNNDITKSQRTHASQFETTTFLESLKNILDRTLFQPPVIGALLGILCAVTPARGLFVDLVNRHR